MWQEPSFSVAHHILPDPWNITISKAIEHLDTIELVGLTELYPESLCLAIYMIQGKLPPGCGEGCIEIKTTHVNCKNTKSPMQKEISKNTKPQYREESL